MCMRMRVCALCKRFSISNTYADRAREYVYICMDACMSMLTCTYACVYMYVCADTCMPASVNVYACMYVCVYEIYISLYTSTSTDVPIHKHASAQRCVVDQHFNIVKESDVHVRTRVLAEQKYRRAKISMNVYASST